MSTPKQSFSTPPSVAAQIAKLPELPMAEFRALWQKLVGGDTPTHNRQFLERRIAYRRAHPRQDRCQQTQGHVDGRRATARFRRREPAVGAQ